MALQFTIEPHKSYASAKNAEAAVKKVVRIADDNSTRYFIMQYQGADAKHIGRFFPVFVGASAIEAGVHFHFNVIA